MINKLFENFGNTKFFVLFFMLIAQSLHLTAGYVVPVAHVDKLCEELLAKVYKDLKIKDPTGDFYQTTTLAYLSRDDLKLNTNRFGSQIKIISTNFFDELFHTILKRELDFASTHYVFYHGQMREFLLPQDIYAGLYNIFYKKVFHDFFILRNKDKALTEFKCINDFQNHFIRNGQLFSGYCEFDHLVHVKKQILPVNVSLFGNALFCSGECTFDYFTHSYNRHPIKQINFVERIFKRFKCLESFTIYKADIKELNRLLSATETTKTGSLLQIFIPKNRVDAFVYRCNLGGGLYYDDQKPENHPISKDLEDYKKKKNGFTDSLLDQFQCRLLVNPELVNQTNGVKIFRYCHETPNVKIYREKLAALLKKIAAEPLPLVKKDQNVSDHAVMGVA